MKTLTQKDMHPYVHCSIIYNSQDKGKNEVSINEWMKKLWYRYTVEYYSAIKRNEILPFATTCIDLEGIMLSEISQTEKDKYHMISQMQHLKIKQKTKLIDSTEPLVARGEGWE